MTVIASKPISLGSGRNIAVRVNILDLTRATERTAIKAAARMGKFSLAHEKGLVVDASDEMLNYLRYAIASRANLVFVDPDDRVSLGLPVPTEQRWPVYELQLAEPMAPSIPHEARSQIDLVVCPIDGKRAATLGLEGGSVSAIAGGAPGTFRDPLKKTAVVRSIPQAKSEDCYFIVTLSPELADHLRGNWHPLERAREARSLTDEPAKPEMEQPLVTFIEDWLNLDSVAKKIADEIRALATSVVLANPDSDSWLAPIRNNFRCRLLCGSSSAAAFTALFGKSGNHISFAIARLTHVLVAATAAKATGGEIVAVPLKCKMDKTKRGEYVIRDFCANPSTQVFGTESFVDGNDAFVVATGISDHPILRGVRFTRGRRASTQSLCLSVGTRSMRYLKTEIDLDRQSPASQGPWLSPGLSEAEITTLPKNTGKPHSSKASSNKQPSR